LQFASYITCKKHAAKAQCHLITIIGRDSDQNLSAAPPGLIFIFAFFPGFRFASPWATFWSPLRGSVHRSANSFEILK